MKIIALGDIHGRTLWKSIVSNTDFDKVVFIGDYFDTREYISAEQQKSNFQDIIDFKKENMDKVVLLFGNHEYHYLRSEEGGYSGFQHLHCDDFQKMIQHALDEELMQMCYIHDKFLFSHAGITKTWLRNAGFTGKEDVDVFVNDLFANKPDEFKFIYADDYNNDGNNIYQSPIWVRPPSLFKDALDNYTHIVGHTIQYDLELNETATIIDTLGTTGQYLVLDEGEMGAMELEIAVKNEF